MAIPVCYPVVLSFSAREQADKEVKTMIVLYLFLALLTGIIIGWASCRSEQAKVCKWCRRQDDTYYPLPDHTPFTP